MSYRFWLFSLRSYRQFIFKGLKRENLKEVLHGIFLFEYHIFT